MSLVRSSFLVSSFIFISRVLGFVRDVLIAKFLGVGIISDAFFIALRVPNTFRRIFGEGAISDVFTPIFVEDINKKNKTETLRFAGAIFWLLFASLLAVTIFIEIIMPNFIHLINPGMEIGSERFNLSVIFSRIAFFFLMFISIASFFGAMLNGISKFVYYGMGGVIFNVALIIGMFSYQFLTNFFENIGYCMIWFFVASGVVTLLYGLYGCWKHKILPSFLKPKNGDNVKLFFKNIGPAIISGGILQINIFVDGMFASFFTGAISYLYYTDRLGTFFISIIGCGISTAILPSLSKLTSSSKDQQKRHSLNQEITNVIMFISIPMAILTIFASKELIHLFFERGEFIQEDTIVVAKMLSIYIISLPFNIIYKIFNTTFCSVKNLKTPMKINIFSLVLNIILNLALFKVIGQYCIIVATATSSIASCFLAYSILKKNGLYSFTKNNLIKFTKITIISILVVIFFKVLSMHLPKRDLFHLINFGLSGVFYVLLCFIFKIEELIYITNILLKRSK